MLSPKFSSPSLLAKSWLPKSSVRPSSPKPIAHTRVSLFQADSTSAKRLIFKRSYYKSSSTNTRASSRTSKPRSMLAAAAAVAVGSAGAAGYSTSTKDSNPNVTNTKDASFTPKFESAAFQIPHPEKADKGGEDTYLVSSDGLMLGVFDGVGGWSREGVDPREYAVKISEGAQEAVDKKGLKSPLEVLRHAAKYANKTVGSSTACLVALDGENLVSANLGDSGYMVIRAAPSGKAVQLIFKSEEQQYSFNFPYQLGPSSSNTADDAEVLTLPVQHGDLVILGTDGLFDNVDAKLVCKVVEAAMSGTEGGYDALPLPMLARYIASFAFRTSQDPKAVTPFSIGSRGRFKGGKEDDITVLIGRVSTKAGSSSSSTDPNNSNLTNSKSSSSSTNKPSDSTDNKFSISKDQSALRAAASSVSTTSSSSLRTVVTNSVDQGLEDGSPSFLQRIFGARPWGATFARL